jgi:hypothetical protein
MNAPESDDCRARLEKARIAKLESLYTLDIQLDPVLAQERRQPGADQRHGVVLIARPPPVVCRLVADLCAPLRRLEPGQYFYPERDLHLTLLEIAHSQPGPVADALAARVLGALPEALADAPRPWLNHPHLMAGRTTGALRFCARDAALDRLREGLNRALLDHGIWTRPRYPPGSAHLTFLRYVGPLGSGLDVWVKALKTAAGQLRELAHDGPEWPVDSLHLTWGATWYGRRPRIRDRGPFRLGSAY